MVMMMMRVFSCKIIRKGTNDSSLFQNLNVTDTHTVHIPFFLVSIKTRYHKNFFASQLSPPSVHPCCISLEFPPSPSTSSLLLILSFSYKTPPPIHCCIQAHQIGFQSKRHLNFTQLIELSILKTEGFNMRF